jgi:acetyl esterase/lipase
MLNCPISRSVLIFCVFSCLFAAIPTIIGSEPKRIPLWQNGAPGEPATKPQDEPVLLLSRPAAEIATPTAVIVIPGGAYAGLAMDHEGGQIADWLNSMGVTAFILKYRLHGTGHQHPIPMLDGQRAIRTVRARAAEWKIDPKRVGIIGFSAGGHLASTLGTHFDAGDSKASDPIDRVSSRPDFMVLCYPVISMTADFIHRGSRNNLLGPAPDKKLVVSLSNETQVTRETPPTFLFHTNEDTGVLPENSIAFYAALRKAGVPAEMHIYEHGPHGVGLAKTIPGTNTWPDRCREWMQTHGLLSPVKADAGISTLK